MQALVRTRVMRPARLWLLAHMPAWLVATRAWAAYDAARRRSSRSNGREFD
jgi:hypothetical protein